MSIDGKDKEESRFPKSSLRARSKTVMMEPSKLEEFRADSLWQDADTLNVDDLLEDNMADTNDVDTVDGGVEASSLDERKVDFFESQPSVDSIPEEEIEINEDVDVEDFDSGEAERFDVEDYSDEDAVEEANQNDLGRGEPSELNSSGYEDFLERERSDVMEQESEFKDQCEHLDDDPHSVDCRDGDRIVWRRQTRLVGFLVAVDAVGDDRYVELHEGRLLISSEPNATENCLVISHPSVSTMHAIMRISSDGSILILDQLSEHGTAIRRASDAGERSLMGDKEALHHGDVVVFGECAYNVCIIDFGASKVDA